MATSPEQSNVTDATKRTFRNKYSLAKRAVEEATGVLRSVLKQAKSAGINTKEMVADHVESKLEPETQITNLKARIDFMKLRGMLIGLPLFDEDAPTLTDKEMAEQAEFDADCAGYAAGMGGQSADDNPYPAGSAIFVAWEGGRGSGAKAKAAILGPTAKQADASRKRRGPKTNAEAAAEVQKARGRPRKTAAATLN